MSVTPSTDVITNVLLFHDGVNLGHVRDEVTLCAGSGPPALGRESDSGVQRSKTHLCAGPSSAFDVASSATVETLDAVLDDINGPTRMRQDLNFFLSAPPVESFVLSEPLADGGVDGAAWARVNTSAELATLVGRWVHDEPARLRAVVAAAVGAASDGLRSTLAAQQQIEGNKHRRMSK